MIFKCFLPFLWVTFYSPLVLSFEAKIFKIFVNSKFFIFYVAVPCYHIQDITVEPSVVKPSSCVFVFFQEFYNFRSSICVMDPFWVHFCVWCEVGAFRIVSFPGTIFWKDCPSSIEWTWYPCEKWFDLMWRFISGLYAIPLVYMAACFMPVPPCGNYHSFVVLKSGSVRPLAFFFQNCSDYAQILCEFEGFNVSVKNIIEISIEIVLCP